MGVEFRNYNNITGFSSDFTKVRDFLIRINQEKFVCINYLWERWEWSFCLEAISNEDLPKMGIWEDNGKIVAMASIEQSPGEVFPFVDSKYGYLKRDVLIYSAENLKKDNKLKVLIQDDDPEFQKIVWKLGFFPTQERDAKAVIDIDNQLSYHLPEGFSITSLADEYDLYKYNAVLWRGFNHGDNPPEDKEHIEGRRISLSSPNQDMNLKIAVVSPQGYFVSYCGMWYDQNTEYALVEPVATDPDYRKMGLGKAAVIEGVKRCGQLGAKHAYVGSSQQFYYKIGFRPVPGGTYWTI
ncbi:MAG: GNAT family N-acetyltransferase [Clostridiales bacterium]|nr:GNAT family N-acetyltransferase [Clostridiales bacterium]